MYFLLVTLITTPALDTSSTQNSSCKERKFKYIIILLLHILNMM